eukprot:277281-Lingulodinium_polyedra.AAC.1
MGRAALKMPQKEQTPRAATRCALTGATSSPTCLVDPCLPQTRLARPPTGRTWLGHRLAELSRI